MPHISGSKTLGLLAFLVAGLAVVSCGRGLFPLNGGGLLAFSSGSLSFAVQLSGEASEQTLSLTNSGQSAATGVQGSFGSRAGAFSFKGGSFPGTGGTCAETIGVGTTCTLVIAFSYPQSGTFSGSLSLTYDGGESSVSLSGTIRAGGYDSTFGTGGFNTYNISTGADYADALIVQPDGKAIIAGPPFDGTGNDNFVLTRFLTTGFLDPSFGVNGIATVSITTGDDRANELLRQPDGKILVCGGINVNGPGAALDFTVARLLSDGSLDTTFGGGDGIASVSITSDTEAPQALALQTDGKILAGGTTGFGTDTVFAVTRFTSDGVIDPTFDTDGIWTMNLSTDGSSVSDIAVQSDGKILVLGNKYLPSSEDQALVRLLTDGTLDTTFGTAGLVTTSTSTLGELTRSLLLQTDGKIVATNYRLVLARYLSDGTLDTSFGVGGIATAGAIGSWWEASLQSDGKILAAGATVGRVARINTNGSLDTTFGSQGIRTMSDSFLSGGARVPVQHTDGTIFIAGWRTSPDDQYAIVKLLP